MAKTWFYKLFENIIAKEVKNLKYDIKVCITSYSGKISHVLKLVHFSDVDLSFCIS